VLHLTASALPVSGAFRRNAIRRRFQNFGDGGGGVIFAHPFDAAPHNLAGKRPGDEHDKISPARLDARDSLSLAVYVFDYETRRVMFSHTNADSRVKNRLAGFYFFSFISL
jgi:hypothetical protein